MKRPISAVRAALALFVLAFLAASPASALKVRSFSTAELVAESALIVRGRVKSSTPTWQGDRIVTDALVDVTESLHGRLEGGAVTVRQLGGRVGDTTLTVPGVRTLRPGDHVLLFLRTDGRFHYLIGFSQGSVFLESDASGALRVRRELSGMELVKRKPVGPARPAPAAPELYEALRTQILALAAEKTP
ncbi:MAG: hypothetical protein IV100_23640 [Myxococcales bacterium]|nr:hypothetical protein [Myxococcales bacterium]